MEGRICFTSQELLYVPVGFWVIPQRPWSIHWAQSWSQDVMPSQQCRNRGGKCDISPGGLGSVLGTGFIALCRNSRTLLVFISLCAWVRTLEIGATHVSFVSGAKDKAMINLVFMLSCVLNCREGDLPVISTVQEYNPSVFLIIKFIFTVSVSLGKNKPANGKVTYCSIS